jgi:hypothetical protein
MKQESEDGTKKKTDSQKNRGNSGELREGQDEVPAGPEVARGSGGEVTASAKVLKLKARSQGISTALEVAAQVQELLGSKGSPETARSLADYTLTPPRFGSLDYMTEEEAQAHGLKPVIISGSVNENQETGLGVRPSEEFELPWSQPTGSHAEVVMPGLSGEPKNSEPFRPTPSSAPQIYSPGKEVLGDNPELPVAEITVERREISGLNLGDDSPKHFPHKNPGPHLLKDRKGNTAWCDGPGGGCVFCDQNVPPTSDHEAKEVDSIWIHAIGEPVEAFPIFDNPKGIEAVINTKRHVSAGWSPERMKELADAESEALDATGGLLAVSPEILKEMKENEQQGAQVPPKVHEKRGSSNAQGRLQPGSPEGDQSSGDVSSTAHPGRSIKRGRNSGSDRRTAKKTPQAIAQSSANPPRQAIGKVINSPEDVAKILPPLASTRPPHDREACRNKYCLICHPAKDAK